MYSGNIDVDSSVLYIAGLAVEKAWWLGTVENHGKKWQKNMAHFCENRKNHGKITAAYIADNLAKN